METGHVDTDSYPGAAELYGYGLEARKGYRGIDVLRRVKSTRIDRMVRRVWRLVGIDNGGVDASVHRSCGGGSLGEGGSQRLDGEAGRDVTSSSTAHAVSDDAELHGLVVEVLIDGADPPDVARGTGTEDDHFVTSKIVSPIWTRSPFFTRVGPSIRSPSIHTPLVEP